MQTDSMEISGLGYAAVDADNHYYEPYDCSRGTSSPSTATRQSRWCSQTISLVGSWWAASRSAFARKSIATQPPLRAP